MKLKYRGDKIERYAFAIGNTIILLLIAFCTLYPFWNTLAVSLNVATDTTRGGITFWPRVFTLQNYRAVFSNGTIFHAFFVSIVRTVIQTITGVFFTSMIAFVLSRKNFMLRKFFTLILIFSMYINAGLIPTYFLMRKLHLINTFLVYVIPGMISAFNFIVIRTYMNSLPESIIESAQIDGCGDFKIFSQIILPLCLPVLATIALFVAVGSWNAWFDTMIYNSRNIKLHTLQYKLMEFLQSSQSQSRSAADIGAMGMSQNAAANMVTPASIRAAITIIAAAPIIIVYPFLQRYFITGLNVGGVKE
jgi:putative aldouronate transport system permease protein